MARWLNVLALVLLIAQLSSASSFAEEQKDSSRIPNPDTRRFEQDGVIRANGLLAAVFAAIRWPH